MKTWEQFPNYWQFVKANHRWQIMRSFDFSLEYLLNRQSCYRWRHDARYGATFRSPSCLNAMQYDKLCCIDPLYIDKLCHHRTNTEIKLKCRSFIHKLSLQPQNLYALKRRCHFDEMSSLSAPKVVMLKTSQWKKSSRWWHFPFNIQRSCIRQWMPDLPQGAMLCPTSW